jgi:hypothetical protein
MEDRGADADERGSRQHRSESSRHRQEYEPREGECHAGHERVGLRATVGHVADDRLQQRRGDLVRERDESDMSEVEREGRLEDWVDRRQQRLHHVVQEVTDAERAEHRKHGAPVRRQVRIDPARRHGRRRRHGCTIIPNYTRPKPARRRCVARSSLESRTFAERVVDSRPGASTRSLPTILNPTTGTGTRLRPFMRGVYISHGCGFGRSAAAADGDRKR